MNHIDKEIYAQQGVSKRLCHLNIWYYILTLLGLIATVLYLLVPKFSNSSLLLIFMSLGGFCLVVIICFYLFGDCRKPYCNPNSQFLERTFDYYPASSRQQLTEALQCGDRVALDNIKRCPTSDLMLVRFNSSADNSAFCQLIEQRNGTDTPLSEVFFVK